MFVNYKNFYTSIACGIVLFTMFFGSGNLIFPLFIGYKTTNEFISASLGLFLTGVLVPFLGLFSISIYNCDKEKFFGILGSKAPFILSALMLILIGPFAISRSIIISYSSLNMVTPISIYLFSTCFLALIFCTTVKKNLMIPIISKYLSPIKILGIIIITLIAFNNHTSITFSKDFEFKAFAIGAEYGYQTLDLIAAFFFAIAIQNYLKQITTCKIQAKKINIKASIIGSSLIAITYISFIIIGAKYANELHQVNHEEFLIAITKFILGDKAVLFVSLIICISSMVTATSLTSVFADFLKSDICNNKISWTTSIVATIIICFIVALVKFDKIFVTLQLILSYLYPALISLTITTIIKYYFKINIAKPSFYLTLLCTIFAKNFIDFCF